MEEARSRVELAIIQSDHQAHAATCVASAGNRQNDVAQAILAGGGSATVAAAIRHVSGWLATHAVSLGYWSASFVARIRAGAEASDPSACF